MQRNQTKRPNRGPSVTPGRHVYRNVRELLVTDATVLNSPPLNASYPAAATGYVSTQLSPMGLQGVQFSTSSLPTTTVVSSPRMPFLYRTGTNFEEYRVTRATLIVTGYVGSTATGRFSVFSSTDYSDGSSTASTLNANVVGGRTYDVASLATREARIPINVSSEWKKVSATTTLVTSGGLALPVSTANDLIFSFLALSWNGTANTTAMDQLFCLSVEYDVEFRKPVASTLNY